MANVNVLLRPREAAAALGISYAAIKQWILAGRTLPRGKRSQPAHRAHHRGLLAKVVLQIGDQKIEAIITSDAAREMQLRIGQNAGALIKSTEVMIVRV
jgi:molybdopterin-binding protein